MRLYTFEIDDQRRIGADTLVVATARKYGLGAGIQPGSLAQAREWMEIGFNVISYSGDLYIYLEALSQAVAGVRTLAGER